MKKHQHPSVHLSARPILPALALLLAVALAPASARAQDQTADEPLQLYFHEQVDGPGRWTSDPAPPAPAAPTPPPGLPGLPSTSTSTLPPAVEEPEDGMHLGVLLGGQVSLSGRAQTALAPLARVEVDGPIPFGKVQNTPWLRVRADFTALPGESIELQNPETFRALQFSVAVSQRVFRTLERGEQRIRLSVFAEGGFATRLPHDPAARDRSVRWGGGGLRLEERSRGAHISVALTADQRLDGVYRAAVVIDGGVQLWRADEGELKGAKVSLIGQAILGLQLGDEPGAQGDVVGVGIAVGR